MSLFLGCIADDYTGASDLASALVKSGLRTVQLIGLPPDNLQLPKVDAIVIALKSRSSPINEAVNDSLSALAWLRERNAKQFFFKYCSTFDSKPEGNIGPVIDAFLEALRSDFTIVCPAFPETGRTMYQGHLFVYNELLSDSTMRDHPITPMTDSNIVRFLGTQTKHKIGLVSIQTVEQGPEAILDNFSKLKKSGIRIAVIDTLNNNHLLNIGAASKNIKLVTGGSGVGIGLAQNFDIKPDDSPKDVAIDFQRTEGPEGVISGSCSQTTLAQVAFMSKRRPVFRFDAIDLLESRVSSEIIVDWALDHMKNQRTFLISASTTPQQLQKAQRHSGKSNPCELIEKTLAEIAKKLVDLGLRRLLIAGGETSGAIVKALGIRGLLIGKEIAPGVPYMMTLGNEPIAMILKSGNFGSEDFFLRAFEELP